MLLVVRALAGGALARRHASRALAVAWLIAVAYGATDEWHQIVSCRPSRGIARPASRRDRRVRRGNRRKSVGYNQAFMSFETLLVERDGAVAVVTINRPKVLNALNTPNHRRARTRRCASCSRTTAIARDRADRRRREVVCRGRRHQRARRAVAGRRQAARARRAGGVRSHRAARQAGRSPRSTASRSAAAASWRWRARCASPRTRRVSASPRSTSGIIPGYAGSQRLPRLVGKGLALEILLTGDMVSGRACLRDRPGQQGRARRRSDDRSARRWRRRWRRRRRSPSRYILEAVNHGCEHAAGRRAVPRSLALRARRVDRRHEGRHAGVSRKAHGRVEGST